jgi:hypothetical protein
MPQQKTTQNSTHECVVCYQGFVNECVLPIPTQGVTASGGSVVAIRSLTDDTPGDTPKLYKLSIFYDLRSVIKPSVIESSIQTLESTSLEWREGQDRLLEPANVAEAKPHIVNPFCDKAFPLRR